MTEIKIEKKKAVWPWIVLALLLAAVLVYFFVFRDNSSINQEADTVTTDSTGTMSSHNNKPLNEVNAYTAFIDSSTKKMGLDHEFTNEALSKLIAAVKAKASEINYDITADLNQASDYAEQITKDPYETSHADKIRMAADVIAGTLKRMQQSHYADQEQAADRVVSAAKSINPDELTLDQKQPVQNFFDEAANLLRNM